MAVSFEDITTKAELIAYHEQHGSGHYFAPDTMRFFDSIVEEGVTHHDGNVYFVTSEQYARVTPRLYSIREMNGAGEIETFGAFQKYGTAEDAQEVIDDF